MDTQNINPEKSNKHDPLNNTGLDKWNDRLDNNLEPEAHGDERADENAENYSEEKGSGDQSDTEQAEHQNRPNDDAEDSMAK